MRNNNNNGELSEEEVRNLKEMGKRFTKEQYQKLKSGLKIKIKTKMREYKEKKFMEKSAFQQAYQEAKIEALQERAKRQAGRYKYTTTERIMGTMKAPKKPRPVRYKKRPSKRKYEIDFSSQLGGKGKGKRKNDIDLMFGRLF